MIPRAQARGQPQFEGFVKNPPPCKLGEKMVNNHSQFVKCTAPGYGLTKVHNLGPMKLSCRSFAHLCPLMPVEYAAGRTILSSVIDNGAC